MSKPASTSDTKAPNDTGQTLIAFQDVSKSYGNFVAVKDLSLDIAEGSVFGFIGPNGAGKTTTIKMLVGLLRPNAGTIRVGDHKMPEERGEIHRTIGYLSQQTGFHSWRTAEHALTTFGLLSDMARDTLDKRISEVLDLVGLGKERRKKVIHMSGGMQRRLGLAQAIMHEPSLLVLDEPLAGLDPANRQQVKTIIEHVVASGVTVLFSSHILSDVQDVATHVGIINQGAIMRTDSLRDLKAAFSVDVDIEVVLSRDSGDLAGLDEIAGVSTIETPEPEHLLIHLDGSQPSDDVVHEVVKGLLARDYRLRSLRPLTPSLDDIYFKILEGAQ